MTTAGRRLEMCITDVSHWMAANRLKLNADETELLWVGSKGKRKKGLYTCYSATYMSQTCDQQRFTISEVAADWHEPMVQQRIMWTSIARANGQLNPRCS